MMAERLAPVHIGNVHLDDRACERVERVEDGDRGVGEGGRIDDDAGDPLASRVYPFDNLVLAIALMELDLKPELGPNAPAIRLDVGQRLAAVNLRLAFPKRLRLGPFRTVTIGLTALPRTGAGRRSRASLAGLET